MLNHQKVQSQRNQSHLTLPKAPNLILNLRVNLHKQRNQNLKLQTQSGHLDDQPDNEAAPKHDWFQTPDKPLTPDPRQPPRTFDELMDTPINFSAYVMNRLKINNLTQEILVGSAFNLLKGSCKSFAELEYHFEECYKAVNDRIDWHNPKGREYLFDLINPLPLIKIEDVKDDNALYKFKEGDFPRLNLCDIEDMLLLLVQKKLSNLDVDDRYDLGVALRMTLSSVRRVLHDIASNLEMDYLPKRH
ncbi:hypothetical protein Tco_1156017 [Tanacetum coccineum]